jgi:hypothetical protein
VLDLSSGNTWALHLSNRISSEQTIIYTIIFTVSLILQILILTLAARIAFKIKKAASPVARIIATLYLTTQVVILVLLCYLLVEQLVTAGYHTIITKSIVGLALMVSVVILSSIAYTCLKSYLLTKGKMACVYGLAMIALSVQLVSALLYVETSINNVPEHISSLRNPWVSYYYTSLAGKLLSVYESARVISFIMIWVASVLLTKSYTKRINRLTYWTIMSLPVFYFLIQYSPIVLNQTGTFSFLLMAKGSIFPYFYSFILSTSNVGSGILFGISFFILSRHLAYGRMKYYLSICGIGIMIIVSSNISQILVLATFPAWAIISVSFILPASFLMLIGIDSATFYIASDIVLRKSLNKLRSQFEFFTSLSSTKSLEDMERKVNSISREIYDKQETEALFATKPELKDITKYVSEIIAEMKKPNGSKNGSSKPSAT